MENSFPQPKLYFGDTIESNHYNPSTGTKGGRIVTEDVCSVYYLKVNIVDRVELMRRTEVARKNRLPRCRYCFYMNIQFPTIEWRGNSRYDLEQKNNSEKIQLETFIAAGKRKVQKRI